MTTSKVVSQSDYDKAESQINLLKDLLASETDPTVLARLQTAIDQIKAEIREYDYLLHPRPAPERCTVCNDGPFIAMPDTTCAHCGLPIKEGRAPPNTVNWIAADGGIAAPIGVDPEELA